MIRNTLRHRREAAPSWPRSGPGQPAGRSDTGGAGRTRRCPDEGTTMRGARHPEIAGHRAHKVTSATINSTGSFTVPPDQGGPGELPPGSVIANLPAYCDVTLVRTHPPAHDEVHFEVWLPLTSWNGRFQGVGGSGYVGGLSFRSLGNALQAGYATASTDAGHPAAQYDGSFALDPTGQLNWPEIEDFADRAIHEMTATRKDCHGALLRLDCQLLLFQRLFDGRAAGADRGRALPRRLQRDPRRRTRARLCPAVAGPTVAPVRDAARGRLPPAVQARRIPECGRREMRFARRCAGRRRRRPGRLPLRPAYPDRHVHAMWADHE